jgi:peptide/nickel transport system substrate-binding protein
MQGRLNRRQLMERGLALGLSVPVILGVLAACGGGDDETPTVGGAASTTASTASTGGASASPASTSAGTPGSAASPGTAQGTSASGGASTGKSVDKVVVLLGAEVRFFDPTQRPTATDATVQLNIYDTLVRMDTKSLGPVPGLATSWEATNDTTWQFKLRQGVKFHDGEDFNADAVVAWFNHLQEIAKAGKASSGQQISSVTSVEKVDDSTVNFITSQPDPILPNRLFTYYTMITPPKPFQDNGPDALLQKGIGTGAYKLKEWVKDDHLTLEANPDYWDGAPLVKTLEFRPVIEASSRASSVLTGEADIDTQLSLGSLDQFQKSDKVDVRKELSATSMYWVQLNVAQSKYFQDLRVRQAVNYAVDKQSIIKNILGGFAVENANIVVKQAWGYKELEPFPYDPDKAKSLLSDAGYKDGFSVKLDYTPGSPDEEVVQAISNFLGDVGIKVELVQYDLSDYIGVYTNKKVDDMSYLGKTQFAIDADYIFQELQPEKLFGWLFPFQGEIEEVYKQEHQELDQAKRKDLAAQIQQYYHDQAGMLFLWQQDFIFGVSKKLAWTPRVDGFVLGKEISGA